MLSSIQGPIILIWLVLLELWSPHGGHREHLQSDWLVAFEMSFATSSIVYGTGSSQGRLFSVFQVLQATTKDMVAKHLLVYS
jgi:hypothetical protein